LRAREPPSTSIIMSQIYSGEARMQFKSYVSVCAGQEIAGLLAKIEFCKSNCITDDMRIMRCCAQAIKMQCNIVALAQLLKQCQSLVLQGKDKAAGACEVQ